MGAPSDYGPSASSGQAELVRRLRARAENEDELECYHDALTSRRAADAIEQLEREAAEEKADHFARVRLCSKLRAENIALRAELARRAIPLPGEPPSTGSGERGTDTPEHGGMSG